MADERQESASIAATAMAQRLRERSTVTGTEQGTDAGGRISQEERDEEPLRGPCCSVFNSLAAPYKALGPWDKLSLIRAATERLPRVPSHRKHSLEGVSGSSRPGAK